MGNRIELDLPVYTFHIDFAGHVSNIVYIQWMEIGRLKLLKAAKMPVEQLTQRDLVPVLVSTEIEYKVPLVLGDQVRLEVWLSELRRASVRMEFRFYNEADILCASGSQKGLFVHRESMRPYRFSDEMRAALEPYLICEKG
jgi:acyl-CoA thioester hydrolase